MLYEVKKLIPQRYKLFLLFIIIFILIFFLCLFGLTHLISPVEKEAGSSNEQCCYEQI